MKKTKKYYIESVLADGCMSTKIEVPQNKFNEALKEAQAKFESQDAKEGDEFYIERKSRFYDLAQTTEDQIEFFWGTCSTYFIKLECKEGYCFRK